MTVILPDGTTIFGEKIHQKHPVSFSEVKGWLKNAFCYIWDEPPAAMYSHMRRMCELVKKD